MAKARKSNPNEPKLPVLTDELIHAMAEAGYDRMMDALKHDHVLWESIPEKLRMLWEGVAEEMFSIVAMYAGVNTYTGESGD